MAETTESVRSDAATRTKDQKELVDWGGRRLVIPKGTTLPAITDDLIEGEVFLLVKSAASNQIYTFDSGINNWVTVGPG